jgi:hypothetical protein
MPELQIKEVPLGHHPGICYWNEVLLLHGLRIQRLFLH